MFVEERQNTIIDLLNENGKVVVKDLSKRFGVTEDCIRKDLAALEKKGALKRAYGGAVAIQKQIHPMEVAKRRNVDTEKKNIIARNALSIIKNGEMIFLDISTITIELAKLLAESDLKITVVTNMIDVMQILSVPSSIELVIVGGVFERGCDGFVGSMANDMISNLRFDKSFLGTVGIDMFDNEITTYMPKDGLTKKHVVARTKEAYALSDVNKFNMNGNYVYASIDDFRGIILDKKPPEKIIKKLNKEHDIKLIY